MKPELSHQSFLRDFFFEFFKDSENLRENNRLDREIWFRGLDLNRKEEHLFELEMYLRAIGCFFNLHNQFLSERDRAIGRDFSEELKVLSAALERGIALSQLLLDRGLESTLNFQSYVENQLAPDYLRLQMLRRNLDQKTPEESLYLLNRCFRDLKKVIEQLLKRPPCTYSLFYHLGQVVIREIAFNRFFNPLLILEFRPEYDRIRSVHILDALRGIEGEAERRAASKIFLALYRLMHYLRYVPRQGTPRILRRSLVLFTLFHSEASTLAGFLRILAGRADAHSPGLVAVAGALSQDLVGELKRLFGEAQVALDVERSRLHGEKDRSIKRARRLLDEFLRDCVLRVLAVFRPGGDGAADLFDDALGQREQAERLRADLWLYRKVLDAVLDSAKPAEAAGQAPEDLSRFSLYFLQTSYNFLRYGDGGPFERYHVILSEQGDARSGSPVSFARFLEDSRAFRGYLIETYDHVCRRADLADTPLDRAALETRLAQWLPRVGG